MKYLVEGLQCNLTLSSLNLGENLLTVEAVAVLLKHIRVNPASAFARLTSLDRF
jgi:hypothetical protein